MAILANEKVLTLDYWKPARLLQVGDYVFDHTGKPVQVKLVQEYRAQRCYQVSFSDHLTVSGDENLTLTTETKASRQLLPKKLPQLLETPLKASKTNYKHAVPASHPLQLPHQTLPVPPFVFGFWFFNCKTNRRMTPPKGFRTEVHEEFQNAGYKLTEGWLSESGEREFSTAPSIEHHLLPNIPHKIPNNYLLADKEQRIALLRGIIYSKPQQYSPKTDLFRFASKHYSQVQQVQFLVESLGQRTSLHFNAHNGTYTLYFKSKLKLMPTQTPKPFDSAYERRYVHSIKEIEPQACVHIETTAPDNTLLVGEGFISTC